VISILSYFNGLTFRSARESLYPDISRRTAGEVKRRGFKNNKKKIIYYISQQKYRQSNRLNKNIN